jgi:hypothetical protein
MPLLEWLLGDLKLDVDCRRGPACGRLGIKRADLVEIMYVFEASSSCEKHHLLDTCMATNRVDAVKLMWPFVVLEDFSPDSAFRLVFREGAWDVMNWLFETFPAETGDWKTKLSWAAPNLWDYHDWLTYSKWLMTVKDPREVVHRNFWKTVQGDYWQTLREHARKKPQAVMFYPWDDLEFVQWIWSLGVLTKDHVRFVYQNFQPQNTSLDLVLWLMDTVLTDADSAILEKMVEGAIFNTFRRKSFDLYFAVELYRANFPSKHLEFAWDPERSPADIAPVSLEHAICLAGSIPAKVFGNSREESRSLDPSTQEVQLRVKQFRSILPGVCEESKAVVE